MPANKQPVSLEHRDKWLLLTEEETDRMTLELGERVVQCLTWENLIGDLPSKWRTDKNLFVLCRAKLEQPELLAQAVGDVQHRHRVEQYFGSARRS